MDDSEYLYIFFHIPKCAGSSFIKTVKGNLKPDELLYLNFDDWRMSPDFGKSYEDYLKRATEYIGRFSEQEKQKIKFIYGHTVPFGIHKAFKRKTRYFTFIRKPEKRALSMYNFFRFRYEKQTPVGRKNDAFYRQFLIDGKVPGFGEWFEEKYGESENVTDTMCKFLKSYGYIETAVNKASIKRALDKFYFVGLVGDFEEDSCFLYKKLGIKRLFGRYNISYKYVKKASHIESAKLKNDSVLVSEVAKKNLDFKRKRRGFQKEVKKMQKKKVFIPFNRAVFDTKETIIELSDYLRRESRLYFRIFNYLRGKPLE